jgi:hypothetical protein
MGFTPYTPITRSPNYVEPIPFDIYQRGQAQKSSDTKQAMSSLDSYVQQIQGIPAIGADAEVLQKKLEEVRQNLSKVALGNIASPQAQNQINSYLSQVSNDTDILAISQRGYAVQNELKAKKDAEEKGRTYVSPLLRQAEKYINDGVYKTDTRFNKQGFIAPDLIKFQEAAQKMAPKQKIWKTLPNGERMQIETQTKEDLANTYYNLIGQDPNGQKYLDDQFEVNHEDVDWEQHGNEQIQDDLYKLQQAKYEAAQMGYSTETFDNQINRLTKLSQSGVTGNSLKQQYKDNYIKDFVNTWADGVDYVQQGDIKLDELDKMRIEHAYKQQDEISKLQLKTGLLQNKDESRASYIQRLAEGSQAKDLEIAKAKSDITLDRQLELEKVRQDGRLGLLEYKTKNGLIKIKDNGEKKVTIGGEELDKATLKGDIERENKDKIQSVLNEYATQFGLTDWGSKQVDPNSVEIVEKDGVKWVKYQDDEEFGIDDNYEVPLSDIVKYVSDPNHIPTVVKDGAVLTGSLDKVDKSNANLPNSSSYQVKAQTADNTLLYSDDGITFYDEDGVEYNNQGNKK